MLSFLLLEEVFAKNKAVYIRDSDSSHIFNKVKY